MLKLRCANNTGGYNFIKNYVKGFKLNDEKLEEKLINNIQHLIKTEGLTPELKEKIANLYKAISGSKDSLEFMQAKEETEIGPTERHKNATELVTAQTNKLIAAIEKFLTDLKPETFATNLANAIEKIIKDIKFEVNLFVGKLPEKKTDEQSAPQPETGKTPAPTGALADKKTQEVIEKSNDFDLTIAGLITSQNTVLGTINDSISSIKILVQQLPELNTGIKFMINSSTGQKRNR